MLVLGGALVWRVMWRDGEPIGTPVYEPTISMEEIEHEVHRAGLAAELLAMADYIGEQPGGEEYARERYTYLASAYPETEGAKLAKVRLEDLRE